MKRRQFPLIAIAILSLVVLIQSGCTKDNSGASGSSTSSPSKSGGIGGVQASAAPTASGACPATGDGYCQCGKTISGSFITLNQYHLYRDTIDLSCVDSGTTVSLSCMWFDVPNNFHVRSINSSSYIATTGWYGYFASHTPHMYMAAWGAVTNVSPAPGTVSLTFVKGRSPLYILEVETNTPPDNTWSPQTDSWSVTICG